MNMFPCFPSYGAFRSRAVNIECSTYGAPVHSSHSHLFHFLYLIMGELHFKYPLFFRAIRHVINLCSTKQMVWITARRIVACVTNKNSIRYWAVNFLKDRPVDEHVFLFSSDFNYSVPSFLSCTRPLPAIFWIAYLYFAPKAFMKGLGYFTGFDFCRDSRSNGIKWHVDNLALNPA